MSLPTSSIFNELKHNIADIEYEADPEKILMKIENKLNDFTLMRKPVFDSLKNDSLNIIPVISKKEDFVVFSAILLSDMKKKLIEQTLLESNLSFSPFSYSELEGYYDNFHPSPTFDTNRILIDPNMTKNDEEKLTHLLLQCGLTPAYDKSEDSINTFFRVKANLIKVKQNTDIPFSFIEFVVEDGGESSIFRTDVFKWDDSDILDNIYDTLSEIGLYSTVVEADPGTIIVRRAISFEMPKKTMVEFYKTDYTFTYSDSIEINENLIKIGEGEVLTSYKNLFVAKFNHQIPKSQNTIWLE